MLEFDKTAHQYKLGGRPLISVTQLMKKHGLAPDYSGIDPAVLERAAERGTLVHKEIEEYIKHDEAGFTKEFADFADYIDNCDLIVTASEEAVHNDICAGTIDLLMENDCGDKIIADIKTTATLNIEAVSWQLSIYNALLGYPCNYAEAFHFGKDGALKVVGVAFKTKEEIERLFQCEREGTIYKQADALDIITPQQVAAIEAAEQIIAQAEAEKKAAEDKIAEIKAALISEMEKRAVKTFETDRLKVTYIMPTTRTTIDIARLKAERPEIAVEYGKTTQTSAGVRITLKGASDARAG